MLPFPVVQGLNFEVRTLLIVRCADGSQLTGSGILAEVLVNDSIVGVCVVVIISHGIGGTSVVTSLLHREHLLRIHRRLERLSVLHSQRLLALTGDHADASLREGALLAVHGPLLLELGIQFSLLDALVLGEEAARPNEVLQVIGCHAVLQLQTLDLRLDDHVVSDDAAHPCRSS